MSEWRLFDGPVPYVSTAAFHLERERAAHLEQEDHRPRLLLAAEFVTAAAAELSGPVTFSDLGCGDGGLLSLVQDRFAEARGYDFQPSNAAGWAERRVTGVQADVFGADQSRVRVGDVAAATEVLEHLADPRAALRWIRQRAARLVCSSPRNETGASHDAVHAWAWDTAGYAALLAGCGWHVTRHETAGRFQVVLAQ